MREMGRIAARTFDIIVLRERPDGRGRPSGEVIRLIAEGVRGAGFPAEHMHSVLDEFEAADLCLRLALPGDLVVLTPASVEEVWAQVLAFRPASTPVMAKETM
jgi:cyanophycin synthetase